MNSKTLVRTLIAVGLGLLLFGGIKWFDYAHFPLDAKAWLIPFIFIPGHVALLMGWSAWLMERRPRGT